MAELRNLESGDFQVVEQEHIFGRAPTSSTRLVASYVSAQHASLRWTGKRWVVRDLGSRNGTYVNGERLAVGEERPTLAGMKLSFGKPTESAWEIVDDSPPSVMVVPIDGGEPVRLDGELLVVPSSDDPQVTIYRGTDRPWMIERADNATTAITNMQTFTTGLQAWRFCCPEPLGETAMATVQNDLEVRHLQLSFSVSRDEEHVSMRMTCGGRTFDLGARSHNYLLLTLARCRIADSMNGLPETSCGWMYQEDLTGGLDAGPGALNIDVYRIRQQFGALGVSDAANIIERRPRTRQLRIGTAHLSIVRL
jgi:FHA domain